MINVEKIINSMYTILDKRYTFINKLKYPEYTMKYIDKLINNVSKSKLD